MATLPKITISILRREIIELAREKCAEIIAQHNELAATTEIEFWCADGYEETNQFFAEGHPFDAIRIDFLIGKDG